MGGRILFLLLSAVLIFAAVQSTAAPVPAAFRGPEILPQERSNGLYRVLVRAGEDWKEAGTLACDRFFREKTLDLGRILPEDGPAFIRLVEEGGGAAHVDALFLGGSPPEAVAGLGDEKALAKLSKEDYDVVDAHGRSMEVTFPLGPGKILALTARVEAEVIGKDPFRFPPNNLYREMNHGSYFYPYKLTSGAEASGDPFFREYSTSGSGHPSGYTYGWVTDDGRNLKVTLDFTSDNTMDGARDYASVHVLSGEGVKEFRVSLPETRWGEALFTYTDKVPYQHKVYHFQIPLAELGPGLEDGREVRLAFSAYGTSTPTGNHAPVTAFDPRKNRYLAVFAKYDGSQFDLYGRFYDPAGSPVSDEFSISKSKGSSEFGPDVAFDPQRRRFLVVWQDDRDFDDRGLDIYARVVRAGGSMDGPAFPLCRAPMNQEAPRVAFNSKNSRYLIVWNDRRAGEIDADIYGQLIKADGTKKGQNIPVVVAEDLQYWPDVAADTTRGKFLVAWESNDPGSFNIHGRLVKGDGTLMGTDFIISDAPDSQRNVALAYDPIFKRYMAAFDDFREGFPNIDIYGQLINSDGTLFNTDSDVNFPVSNHGATQASPGLAYDSIQRRYTVSWTDERNGLLTGRDLYYQLIGPGGAPLSFDTALNWPLVTDPGDQERVRWAFNSNCLSLMAVYANNQFVPSVVGVKPLGFPCPSVIPTRVFTPEGGLHLPSGWGYPIQWSAPPRAVKCTLKETFNDGSTWSLIRKNVKGRDYTWEAIPWNNTDQAKVKVTCYRKNGSKAGSDTSEGLIRVEVMRTVIPGGGEVLSPGAPFLIEWITNKTRKDVHKVKLMLSRDGGSTWEKIDVIKGNPGFYEWLVPSFGSLNINCKIKVILLSKNGRKVGSGISLGLFTILP